jgi:hypothetical protein
MGGVDFDSLLMVFIVSFSSMLLVAAIGIAVSVHARKAREAVSTVYLILFAWLAWPLLLLVTRLFGFLPTVLYGPWLGRVDWLLRTPNPFDALRMILHPPLTAAGIANPWQNVAQLVLMHLLITSGCLAIAVGRIRPVQRRLAGKADQPPVWRWRWQRVPVLIDRPMLWKELYIERVSVKSSLAAQVAASLIVVGVIGATAWNFWNSRFMGGTPEEFVTYTALMSVVIGCAGLLLIGSRAAGSITSEKERDCWVSLLGTTLSGQEIVTAKVLGNIYAGRGVFLLMAFLWGMATVVKPAFVLAAIPLAITLGGQALFATSLGLLISLRSTSTLRAMGGTMGLLILIGGGYLAFCAPFLMMSNSPDESFILLVSALVPFLLAFPSIVCAEGWPNGAEGAVLTAAFVFGTIGYWVAGCITWQYAIQQFDQWSGRMRPWRYWDAQPIENHSAAATQYRSTAT